MKKYIEILFVLVCLTGCGKEMQQTLVEECLVSFSLGGEITTSATPMTKASTNDLYLVQVYRGTSAFAFGVYDDPQSIQIPLKKGTEKFRFIISLLRNGKTRLGSNYSSVTNSYYSCSRGGGTFTNGSGSSNSGYHRINHVYINSVGTFRYYSNATSTELRTSYISSLRLDEITTANLYGNKYPVCDDWFYGEINNYTPTGSYETLSLDLKRVGFQVKYELSGVTDGTVTVKLSNSTKTFIDKAISTSSYSSEPQFYAFYDVHSAWQHANDYSENFTLSVSWLRGIGITEDYGTKTIQLKRNCLNNIKISMGNNDQSAGMSVTAEAESSIGSDNVVIPVQ